MQPNECSRCFTAAREIGRLLKFGRSLIQFFFCTLRKKVEGYHARAVDIVLIRFFFVLEYSYLMKKTSLLIASTYLRTVLSL